MMSNTNKLIAAFVLLILGIVFASQVASIGQSVTTLTVITGNESLDLSPARAELGNFVGEKVFLQNAYANNSWQADASGCDIVNFRLFLNASDELEITTDYTTDGNGGIIIINGTKTGDVHANNASIVLGYSYCETDYLNLGWGRTGINLVPGFFALALLMMSIGLFYSIAKENGIV